MTSYNPVMTSYDQLCIEILKSCLYIVRPHPVCSSGNIVRPHPEYFLYLCTSVRLSPPIELLFVCPNLLNFVRLSPPIEFLLVCPNL